MSTPLFRRAEALSGARDILPIALGVAIYGMAYGVLAVQAGFAPHQVAAMGMIVFAGGSQIVATQQLLAGAGAVALNLRMMLVTASIREVYAGRPWWQMALGAHVTTDENWALMLAERAKGRDLGYPYLIGGGVALWTIWMGSTVGGAVFAAFIPEPKSLGMDFAFTAAFIAIARSLFKGRADLVPWLVAAATVTGGIGSGVVGASWALVLGGIAGAIVAGAMRE
jgi:predicted branched-subunit amino acid permease